MGVVKRVEKKESVAGQFAGKYKSEMYCWTLKTRYLLLWSGGTMPISFFDVLEQSVYWLFKLEKSIFVQKVHRV